MELSTVEFTLLHNKEFHDYYISTAKAVKSMTSCADGLDMSEGGNASGQMR